MFRNYRQTYYQNCNCQSNSNATDELIEDKCENVSSYEDYQDSCECGFDEDKPNIGLKMGTIFPELVSPYMPGQSMKEIAYLKKTNEIGEGCNKCQ